MYNKSGDESRAESSQEVGLLKDDSYLGSSKAKEQGNPVLVKKEISGYENFTRLL